MQRKQRFVADQRFDLPQYDSMMQYISDEFKAYNKAFLSPLSRVVSGWKVESNGGLSVRVNNLTASMLFASEKPGQAGMNFRDAGMDLLVHTLADNAINFVEVQIVSGTCAPDTVALWDTTANSGQGEEYTQTVDTAYEERPVLTSNTIAFTGDADKLPLAIVTTSGGMIVSIVDSRKFLFQLESDWNFGSTRTDTTIGSLKGAYDAITTVIKEMKGSPAWYDKPFASSKVLKEYQNLFISGGGQISWQTTGADKLAWTSDFDIEIADREWPYELPAGNVTLTEGQALYIDIPIGEPLAPLTPMVANLADVPIDPASAGYSAGIQVLFFRRNNKVISTTLDMPDLEAGESSTVGEDLPQAVRTRLGVTSTEGYVPYTSTVIIASADNYALALSKLDAQIWSMLNSNPDEQVFNVGAGGQSIFNVSSFLFNVDNDVADIIVSVNGQIVEVDRAGGLTKDYRKNSTQQLQFAYTVPQNATVKVWRSVANGGSISEGGSGAVGVQEEGNPITSSASTINFVGSGVTAFESAPGVVEVQVNTSAASSLKKLVKNGTASPIPAGRALTWVSNGTVDLADADLPNKSLFAGISENIIPAGAYGFAIKGGNVANVLASLGCSPGDTIYIGETPGLLVKNPPLDLSDTIFKIGKAEPADGDADSGAIDLFLEPEVISTPS